MDWPVRRCGSSDYRKRVPSMGSTRVQEDAEDQGVRRQKEDQQEEPRKRAPKRNQEEEPRRGTEERKTTPPVSRGN